MTPSNKITIIGIAGGSCSGKTTLAKKLQADLGGENRCALLFQDSYYFDQSAHFKEDGGEVNFDHPSAIDFSLMGQHLEDLAKGLSVQVPIYDFATHSRKTETIAIAPRPFIVVDGTLILAQDEVYRILNYSVFLEVDESTRFDRRKRRDVAERGRQLEGVERQFLRQVKPMHDQFVQDSSRKATLITGNSQDTTELMTLLKSV